MNCIYRNKYECIEKKPTNEIYKIWLTEQLCSVMGKNIDAIEAFRLSKAGGYISEHGSEGFRGH